ncbi:MAG: polyribonucleotide nucleotidyltransferase [Desulfobacteraceae bacterium]|nr:polyribonucleotide nucleotidyltransferase [Desulfobacteraceae bacterium]MCB9494813.1 polyribonucleotide nucleotidyltransferase [Desulfobacteraceae bacterium]
MEQIVKAEIGGRELTISTGKIAKQASGAVIVQYGESMVLVTSAASSEGKDDIDFLPLTVEYMEKIYAAGRIPGNYMRREMGRPSEKATLTCRLIDRPIRPLFPDNYTNETQIIATVLSMDKENDPDILAMIGASASLAISEIPFDGPIGAVRVGRINKQIIINPTIAQQNDPECDINIVLTGSKTGITMVEGGGNIVSESDVMDAIFAGHDAMQPIIAIQEELARLAGKPKMQLPEKRINQELLDEIESLAKEDIKAALKTEGKFGRKSAVKKVKEKVKEALAEKYAEDENLITPYFEKITKQASREIVLKEKKRIDGRAFDEVRPIACDTKILPRVHGSGLFTRGETQVLGVLTLGSGQDEQRVETLSGDESNAFMLHYNFPPFCVGEVKRLGGPSRREYGHGALAYRALEKVLPKKEEFEYTIRIVSEVMESNGSSSMGTVCAGTLALMDGGVPIKAPVSGIAMGLVSEGDEIAVLSDILGDEDHTGDMDFKVAGTKDGITSIQMDIKIKELSRTILEKALHQAKEGRLHILDKMLSAISVPRTDISEYAPKIVTMKIKQDKIAALIGPAGKVIREIQSSTNTNLEVTDDGTVKVSANSKEASDAAIARINEICLEPEIGKIYPGKVARTTDFGAFVDLSPNTTGLLHISELANYRVAKVTDIVNPGDIINVKVLDVTRDGKIQLSLKEADPEQAGKSDDSDKKKKDSGKKGGFRKNRNDRNSDNNR